MPDMDNQAGTPNDDEVAAKLRGVLDGLGTLTLATCGEGVPWAAGGFFAEDGLFTLHMILETQGRTMTNLRSNPRVGVSITTGNPFEPYVQAEADVEVLSEADEVAAAHAALKAKTPAMEPLFAMPVETVRLRVRTWKVSDIPNGWLPAKVLTAPSDLNAVR